MFSYCMKNGEPCINMIYTRSWGGYIIHLCIHHYDKRLAKWSPLVYKTCLDVVMSNKCIHDHCTKRGVDHWKNCVWDFKILGFPERFHARFRVSIDFQISTKISAKFWDFNEDCCKISRFQCRFDIVILNGWCDYLLHTCSWHSVQAGTYIHQYSIFRACAIQTQCTRRS